MARELVDLNGQRFGKLIVLFRAPDKNKQVMWDCVCDCGNTSIVRGTHLRKGLTVSCGCYRIEANKTHGQSDTRLYKVWSQMVQRCSKHKDYAGRGITVCDRWRESFENFLEDMGQPEEGLTLDRIDTNGDYCPENCRWVNMSIQGFNQRKRLTNTSGKSGVSWNKRNLNWRARITVMYKEIHLGYFDSFEEAVEVREKAEIKYFGENKS